MRISQANKQISAIMPQTVQCRQLLLLPIAMLESFLSRAVVDNPYLEVCYETEHGAVLCGDLLSEDLFDRDGTDSGTALTLREELCGFETTSLQDALRFQASLLDLFPDEQLILDYLISCTDSSGYLREALSDIAAAVNCSVEKVENLLTVLQGFSPSGVGARSLEECLLLQVPAQVRNVDLIRRVIAESLPLVAGHRYDSLKKKYHVDAQCLWDICGFIRSLQPKPGSAYGGERVIPYVYPDASVSLHGQELELQITGSAASLIRFDRNYMKGVTDPEAVRFLRGKKEEAVSLLNSLDMRYHAMSKLLEFVILQQRDFFLAGPSHLKPVTMREAAASIGIHPSTVSRCVSGKYLQTPWGIYPMHYFFPVAVLGDQLSDETAKQEIARLIEGEDKTNPISDESLVERLFLCGIHISRRTVTKYREQLDFGNRRQRRHYL